MDNGLLTKNTPRLGHEVYDHSKNYLVQTDLVKNTKNRFQDIL